MGWTTKPPDRDGFYFWQGGRLHGDEVAVVQVTAYKDRCRPLLAQELCIRGYKNAPPDSPAQDWGGRWAGPIPPPRQFPVSPTQDGVAETLRDLPMRSALAQLLRNDEGLIADAVTAVIGDGWTPASVAGRLVRKIYPGGVEVYAVDGVDLVELHPARFELVTEAGSIQIRASRDYRLLVANTRDAQAPASPKKKPPFGG